MIEYIGTQKSLVYSAWLTLEQVAKSTHMRLHYLQAPSWRFQRLLPLLLAAMASADVFHLSGIKTRSSIREPGRGVQPDGEARKPGRQPGLPPRSMKGKDRFRDA